jgi:hypothetical protein
MLRNVLVVLCFLAFWSLPAQSADWEILNPDGDPVEGMMMFATNGTFPNQAPHQLCKVRIYRRTSVDPEVWTSVYYDAPMSQMGVNWSHNHSGAVTARYKVQLREVGGDVRDEVIFDFTSTM